MDNNDILSGAKKLNINNDMIKLFCNYIDLKDNKWSLRTFHYNMTRQEIVATDGRKLIIVNNKCEIVKDYISFFEDMKKDITNIKDNPDLLFNLEFYLKYSKLCNLYYKVQETKNSYNLIAINAKNNQFIASEPDLQCTYPDYSYAIDNISYNTQAKIDIPLMLKTLKDITNAIKEHNKLCKLKKDKTSTIDAKKVILDLAFSNNELNISLVTYTSTTSNINLLDPELRLLNIYSCDYTSTSDNTSKHLYVNASYLLDILQSFKNLYETNITLHVNFNNKLPEPLMFLPSETNNKGIKSYLMPIKVQK